MVFVKALETSNIGCEQECQVSTQLEEWSMAALEVAPEQDSHCLGCASTHLLQLRKKEMSQEARHFLRVTVFRPPLHTAGLYLQPGTVS